MRNDSPGIRQTILEEALHHIILIIILSHCCTQLFMSIGQYVTHTSLHYTPSQQAVLYYLSKPSKNFTNNVRGEIHLYTCISPAFNGVASCLCGVAIYVSREHIYTLTYRDPLAVFTRAQLSARIGFVYCFCTRVTTTIKNSISYSLTLCE